MKHLLITATALFALSACGGGSSAPETDVSKSLIDSISAETDMDTLLKLEAEANAKIEAADLSRRAAAEEKSKITAAIGKSFLVNNAKADGVETSASGLQYKVIQPGLDNGASADPGQGIAAHYHGLFINGDVFDSSYNRGQPLRGPSNGFIQGWNEAFGEMKVCEARTLYIGSELGYGDRDRGPIPAGSTLIFHMQLLEVQKTGESDAEFKCPEDKILAGPEAY